MVVHGLGGGGGGSVKCIQPYNIAQQIRKIETIANISYFVFLLMFYLALLEKMIAPNREITK